MASSGTIGKFNTGGNDYLVASTAFATCSTAANIAAKVATIQDGADFTLIDGITIHVYFDASNTADSPTLNVNNTGAHSIYFANNVDTSVKPGVTPSDSWAAGAIITLTYYGESEGFEFWYINNNAPAIFPVVFTPTSQDLTTATSSKRAWEIALAVVNGQMPLGLLAMGQNLYALSYLTYVGAHPLTQQYVAVFSYSCFSTNVLTHLNYHYATLTVDNSGNVTIEWTDLVHGVTVNGSSVVSSGTAAITAVTDVEVDGVSVVNNGVASITSSGGTITDVEVNGTSVVSGGVASITAVTDVTVDGTSVVDNGTAEIISEVYNAETSTDYGYSIQQAFDAGKIVYWDITANNISQFTCYKNESPVSTRLYEFYGRYILTVARNDYTGGSGSCFGSFYFTRSINDVGADATGVSYQYTLTIDDDYGAWTNEEIYRIDLSPGIDSTDTSSKIYLIGATSQSAGVSTYSDNQVYATNGQLDMNKARIAETATIQWNSTDSSLDFVFA